MSRSVACGKLALVTDHKRPLSRSKPLFLLQENRRKRCVTRNDCRSLMCPETRLWSCRKSLPLHFTSLGRWDHCTGPDVAVFAGADVQVSLNKLPWTMAEP